MQDAAGFLHRRVVHVEFHGPDANAISRLAGNLEGAGGDNLAMTITIGPGEVRDEARLRGFRSRVPFLDLLLVVLRQTGGFGIGRGHYVMLRASKPPEREGKS